jgi:hypothetical protein
MPLTLYEIPRNPFVYEIIHFPILSEMPKSCSCKDERYIAWSNRPFDCAFCGSFILPHIEPTPPLPRLTPPSSPLLTIKANFQPRKRSHRGRFEPKLKKRNDKSLRVVMCQCSDNCGHLSTLE